MSDTPVQNEAPLTTVLDHLRGAANGTKVSVGELIKAIGEHSFATMLLVVALIMITPLSGIPGAPSVGALVILLIVGQWLLRRDHLWLPDFVMRRSMDTKRFNKALGWLDKPAAFIDRHTHSRLTLLARGPLKVFPLLVIVVVVFTWPFLELLPFFTTICAIGIALLAFGLMTRDGLFIVLGLTFYAVLGLVGLSFI
jgi:hypothetical protein